MNKYHLPHDLQLFYVQATSFLEGVQEAFDRLRKLLPATEGRNFYGISRPNNQGIITYRAAVLEIVENEGKKYGCESFLLKKGEYMTETITDWPNKIDAISPAFYRMLNDPRHDEDYPCIEWYKNENELVCMIRIDRSKIPA